MHACARAHTHLNTHSMQCKDAPGRMTLTCGSTNAGVAPPFCLEKQKEAIGGRREGEKKGRTAREGCREAAGDGWMEGGREGGEMRRDAREVAMVVVGQ